MTDVREVLTEERVREIALQVYRKERAREIELSNKHIDLLAKYLKKFENVDNKMKFLDEIRRLEGEKK